MKIFAKLTISATIAASALIGGCASTSSGSVYSGGQARQEQTVRMGVVESVRQVSIEGSKSGVGTLAGGAIGGVAGSNIGGERAATMYSILQTAKLNGLNPEAYLTDTLARIAAGHPINRIDELMPWAYRRPDADANP